MDRVLKPTGRLVAAAFAVVGGAIALYLFVLLQVYILAWIVQLLSKLG